MRYVIEKRARRPGRLVAAGVAVILLAYPMTVVLGLIPATIRRTEDGPAAQGQVARRLFYELRQGAPLEMDASLVRERLMISLVHLFDPLTRRPVSPLLEVSWLDAEGALLGTTRLRKTLRPHLPAQGPVVFAAEKGLRASPPRLLVLEESGLPQGTASIRLALLEPLEGQLLVRFFTKELLSVGPRAAASSKQRLERLEGRTSLPADLQTPGVFKLTTRSRWRTQGATSLGGHAASQVLSQREVSEEEREEHLRSLAGTRASPTWREVGRGRTLVYDLSRAGRFELFTDGSPKHPESLQLQLLLPGQAPRAINTIPLAPTPIGGEGLLRRVASFEATSPATLIVRSSTTEQIRLRLEVRSAGSTFRVPVAEDSRISYLIGPSERVSRLIEERQERVWEGEPILPPEHAPIAPPGEVTFDFTPEEAAQEPVVIATLRRLGGAGALTVRWRLEGEGERQQSGKLALSAPPPDLGRLGDSWKAVLSGPTRISLRCPAWSRRLVVSTEAPAVAYASLVLESLLLDEIVPPAPPAIGMPVAVSEEAASRYGILRASNDRVHRANGSTLRLQRQRGSVRAAGLAPPPLAESISLNSRTPGRSFLVPDRPLGSPPPRAGSLRPARRNIYRKLRGVSRVDVLGQTAPEPLELIRLVPGQPALRRLLVQEEIQVRGESYLRDPAEGGLGWSLRQLTLAERASPAELSVDLERGRRGRLVLDLALAQPGGAVVAVDLVPIREFVTPPASRGWPTGTRHLYHLRGEGRGSVDLETSRTLPGATWRISFPLRGDLPSGTYVLRVRPQGSSSRVWVGARAALEGLLEPGQPWRVRIPPGSKSVLVEAGSSSQGPSALGIMADGSRRPLQLGQATAVSSSWLGLELAAGSTPLAGWVVTATGATGPRHLPRAELRLVAEHLPLEVTLPPARRAAKLRARLYWSGLTTPPREGLALEITGPEGVARQPLEPVFELRSELLPKSSAGAVWASRSISITGLSSASTSVRVVGPASLSATLEERVAPPESIVHVFHGVRDGGAQRPAKPLLRAYRRHGRFRRLSPTRGGGREVFLRSPVALAPALVAPTLQPLLTSKSESIVLRGVEDLVELTRLVEAETPMAPVPVRRRVLPGRTLELELADPQFPNAASTDLRLYYRGVQPNPDPPWIKAWIDGERVLRERAIGGQGLLRAPDVPTGRSQLVVRVEGSLAGGKLYVATLAVPAVGDLRQFKAWAPGLGTKELRFRAPAAPGHQLLLEVYGKRPAGEAWTAWDLRIRSAQSQVQVERHYTAGLLSSQGPLIEQDGQRVWLRIRVLWENRDAARGPLEGSLRGRILPQDRVRALHLWEEKE